MLGELYVCPAFVHHKPAVLDGSLDARALFRRGAFVAEQEESINFSV